MQDFNGVTEFQCTSAAGEALFNKHTVSVPTKNSVNYQCQVCQHLTYFRSLFDSLSRSAFLNARRLLYMIMKCLRLSNEYIHEYCLDSHKKSKLNLISLIFIS